MPELSPRSRRVRWLFRTRPRLQRLALSVTVTGEPRLQPLGFSGAVEMERTRLDPERITRPIQLAAAWFAALVLVEGGLLLAAGRLENPDWAPGVLVVAAIVIPFGVGAAVFFLPTRYRPELLADRYYAEIVHRKEEWFQDFRPVRVAPALSSTPETASAQPTRSRREAMYMRHRGLFLIHSWRPSSEPGQVADIVIRLYQHREGPLKEGTIERVEYDLGRNFSSKPLVRTNRAEDFRLDVSAYGSALCVATVHFNDGSPPLVLDRYIDFN